MRRVASHWNDARGQRRAPAWSDIDPGAIGPCLPIVWAWRWEEESGQFIGRLAGAVSERMINKPMRGRTLVEVFGDDIGRQTHDLYYRAMSEPALFRASGLVYGMFGGVGEGERIVMPLADGVLGATSYFLQDEAGEPVKGHFEPSQRSFYALE